MPRPAWSAPCSLLAVAKPLSVATLPDRQKLKTQNSKLTTHYALRLWNLPPRYTDVNGDQEKKGNRTMSSVWAASGGKGFTGVHDLS
jgi:hypothetical protein